MSINLKRKNITLPDSFSPLVKFIKARNALKDIYYSEKKSKIVKKIKNNRYNFKFGKDSHSHQRKLLQDEIYMITHFTKTVSNKIDYGSSVLNPFGNRNSFIEKYDKAKLNTFTKFQIDNYNSIKITSLKNLRKKYYQEIKLKSSYDNKFNLPKLNVILKKNSKTKKINI